MEQQYIVYWMALKLQSPHKKLNTIAEARSRVIEGFEKAQKFHNKMIGIASEQGEFQQRMVSNVTMIPLTQSLTQ